jgi:hypothetical protein
MIILLLRAEFIMNVPENRTVTSNTMKKLQKSVKYNFIIMNLPTMNSRFEQYRNVLGRTDVLYRDSCMENNSKSGLFVANVHSVQQKSSGLIFRTSRSGSHVTYSYHHNSSRFSFSIFVNSWRFSVFHSLQTIMPCVY